MVVANARQSVPQDPPTNFTINVVGEDVVIESVTVEYSVGTNDDAYFLRDGYMPVLSMAATNAAGSAVREQSGRVDYTIPQAAMGETKYTGAVMSYSFAQADRVTSVDVKGILNSIDLDEGIVQWARLFVQDVTVAYGVPAPQAAPQDGASPADKGTITVGNPVKGETYEAYRILDLASFQDADAATGEHKTDAYSYAIRKDSPWLGFVEAAKDASGNKLFAVDKNNPVKMADTDATADYYVVEATGDFKNAFADASQSEGGVRDETGNAVASSSLVQKFAQDARKYVADWNADSAHASNKIAPAARGTGPESGALVLTIDGATVDGASHNDQLPLGYYLIDTSTGSLCALDTTNKDVTVFEKNDLPTIGKKVQEDRSLSTNNDTDDEGDLKTAYQKVNDATVGDTVHYRTDIDVEKGAQSYVLHDRMEAGLTYVPSSLKVWYVPNGGDLTQKVTDGPNKWVELKDGAAVTFDTTTYKGSGVTMADFYIVSPAADGTGAPATTANGQDTFTVAFAEDFLTFLSDHIGTDATAYDGAIADTTTLVVEYAATLNENAEVASANTNETWLVYGDQTATDTETTHKFTDTYTWPVQVYKYTGDLAGSPAALEGAVFELWENETHTPKSTDSHTRDGKFRFVALAAGDQGYDQSDANPQYMVVGKGTATTTDGGKEYVTLNGAAREVLGSITTGASGKFTIKGLDEDAACYYLHEVAAPKGYNRLAYDIRVKVESGDITNSLLASRDGGAVPTETVKYANKSNLGSGAAYGDDSTVSDSTQDSIPVENNTGAELPSTGGIGTTIFYVAGTVLVVGAVVMLVAKRRMGAEA